MLTLPSDLLSKIESNRQTIANNANPIIDVLSQKFAKYINKGTFLDPSTIRTGNSLNRLDVCIRREDKNLEPSEIVMIYIENGLAKVATLPYIHMPDELFTYKYTIGPATDVACDFDGRFAHITDREGLYFDTSILWTLVTFGDPYFAVVNDGALIVYHETNDPLMLCDLNVTRVSLLRGWKSVTNVLTDQGLICAYVKTDGKAYYRNYCEQETGEYIWETEREITELGTGITDLGLFRTADYRMGFLIESSGTITWTITDRSWSGMATPPEYLYGRVTDISISVMDINFFDAYHTEYLSGSIDNLTLFAPHTTDLPILKSAYNIDRGDGDWGYVIRLHLSDQVIVPSNNELNFKIVDDIGITWYASSIVVSIYDLIITFGNMNNAVNPVNIIYTPGTITNTFNNLQGGSVEFHLTNLVPYEAPPPVIQSITTLVDWSEYQ